MLLLEYILTELKTSCQKYFNFFQKCYQKICCQVLKNSCVPLEAFHAVVNPKTVVFSAAPDMPCYNVFR